MATDARSDDSLATRVVKALSILFGVHLQFARREASRDFGRVAAGLALIGFGLLMLFFALAFLHLASVWWVHQARKLPWVTSILVVCGADAVIALFCFVVGRARVKKPFLEETRGLVKKTVSALTD